VLPLGDRYNLECFPGTAGQFTVIDITDGAVFECEIEEQFEGNLKARHDVWRACVGRVVQSLPPKVQHPFVECRSELVVAAGEPPNERAHDFGVAACLGIPLACA
jgi:hypothetical protein